MHETGAASGRTDAGPPSSPPTGRTRMKSIRAPATPSPPAASPIVR